MTTHDCGQAKDRRRRNSTFALVRGLTIRGSYAPPSLGPLLVFLLLASGAAVSCSSNKILTSSNSWAFHTARYNESCVNPAPGCACRHEALARWRGALDEARDAVRRGGKYPLQIRALKDAEAKLGECK